MADIIVLSDLPASVRAHELIDVMLSGANAKASRVAPCLVASSPVATDDQLAEARLVLVGAVKRWTEAGSGALSSQSAGPFGMTVDTRQRTGFNLWPSEITDLQAICSAGAPGREAFAVDTAGPYGVVHAEACSLFFGAEYCDCGADLAGFPLFESS